jgi:hypothetical protein
VVEHHLLDIGEGDVTAVGRVVQAAIRILLDDALAFVHALLPKPVNHYKPLIMLTFEFGAAVAKPALVRCTKKSLTSILHVLIIQLCGAAKTTGHQTSQGTASARAAER